MGGNINFSGNIEFEKSVDSAKRHIEDKLRGITAEVDIKADTKSLSGEIAKLKSGFGKSFEPANASLNRSLSKAGAKQLKIIKESLKNQHDALTEKLRKDEISLGEAQKKYADISAKTRSVNEGLKDSSLSAFGAIQYGFANLIETAKHGLEGDYKDALDGAKSGAEGFSRVAGAAMNSAAASFGKAIAEGKNLEEATSAMLTNLLNSAQQAILIYIPEIFAQAVAWLGPIAGPAAAAGLIATVQGLLAIAQNAAGADKGVIDINERYRKKPTARDVIPLFARKGESVLTPEFTGRHRDLLAALHGGMSEEAYFKIKYAGSAAGNHALAPAPAPPASHAADIGGLAALKSENAGLRRELKAMAKAFNDGMEVRAESFISITDNTKNKVKVHPWR